MAYLAKSLPFRILFNLMIVITITFSRMPPATHALAQNPAAARQQANGLSNDCIFKYCLYFPAINGKSQPDAPGGPDLALTMTGNPSSIDPGAVLVYTLTYRNNGPSDALGVMLYEYLAAAASFSYSSSTSGWQQLGSSREYTLVIPSLASGARGEASFAVTAADPVPQNITTVDNNAWITDDSSNKPDPNLANNTASLSTPVNVLAPDLYLTLSDGGSPVAPGSEVLYALHYYNIGTAISSGVSLTETLPANTSFYPSDSAVGWQLTNGAYHFSIGHLGIGEYSTVNFAVKVAASPPPGTNSISNTASISDDGSHGADLNLSNNSASISTIIIGQ